MLRHHGYQRTRMSAPPLPCRITSRRQGINTSHATARASRRIVRPSDCSLLLHRVLDALVDAIGPASSAIENAVQGTLEAMRAAQSPKARWRRRGRQASQFDVSSVHDLQREVGSGSVVGLDALRALASVGSRLLSRVHELCAGEPAADGGAATATRDLALTPQVGRAVGLPPVGGATVHSGRCSARRSRPWLRAIALGGAVGRQPAMGAAAAAMGGAAQPDST